MIVRFKEHALRIFECNDTFLTFIKFVLIFNLIDGIFTLFYIELGIAEEGNPIMNHFYTNGPSMFMAIKIFLVIGGCYVLYKNISQSMSKYSISLILLMYYLLIIYHILSFNTHCYDYLVQEFGTIKLDPVI